MSLVHVFGLCIRVETHSLDPLPVPCGATPALWMLVAGLLVHPSTLAQVLIAEEAARLHVGQPLVNRFHEPCALGERVVRNG